MKNSALWLAMICIISLPLHSLAATEIIPANNKTGLIISELSGRDILNEVSLRHDQKYEFEIQAMTLVDKQGNQETREMHRYKRQINAAETRYVSVFLNPAGIKGVSLLTWQHQNSDDDQWLYLPAYGKKMKRIAKGGRKNYFMGTDYTFEDLVAEAKDKFAYQRLDDEILDGVQTFVIQAQATDAKLKKATGYGFRKLWIQQDNFMLLRTDFFDKRERLIKRQLNSDLVQIKDNLWRANKIELEHFMNQHKTLTSVVKRGFDGNAIPEKYFTERTIIKGMWDR